MATFRRVLRRCFEILSAFVLAPVIGEFSREPLKHAFFLHFFDTFPHLSKCERD